MDLAALSRHSLIAVCFFSWFAGVVAQDEEVFDPFDPSASEVAGLTGSNDGSFLKPGEVQKLTERIMPSIATVRQIGRNGNSRGIGSGFIVNAEEGLIATNLHVIGENRMIEVELNDGTVLPVTEIHTWDRHFDLAVLKIDADGKELISLPLGDSNSLKQGQIIAGFGAPMGLKSSVVTGIISAIRKLDDSILGEETPDYPMIQIAMPVEQGNSGGPIVNLKGEVLGIVTLRHRMKENLGFAVRIGDLQSILAKPNPIPMNRWRTVGALDPRQWTVVMEGDWNQRGGVIFAKNPGAGFGGRTLCLSSLEVPENGPFEVAVKVKLDDEGGAAGLAFSADGGDRHYGFYPSGGRMRLTRFDGPDVYSWDILRQEEVNAYNHGEWNRLRVRIEGDRITAFVNGEEAFSLEDSGLRGGKAGLCKFRTTEAKFREFKVGKNLAVTKLTEAETREMDSNIETFIKDGNKEELLERFSGNQLAGREFLEEKAREFERLAEEMRRLQAGLHYRDVETKLISALTASKAERNQIDLFEVALQIARIDDPNLDEEHYRSVFGRLVSDAADFLDGKSGKAGVQKLRDFLFKQNGFHGSRHEYYQHANSYINRVIDDREGLPITLSVLFIEMARRLELKGVHGVAFPGQFLVGFRAKPEDDLLLINVFEGGTELSRAEAELLAMRFRARTNDATFEPSPPRSIATRMLNNLINIEIEHRQNPPAALDYLNLWIALEPDSVQPIFQRALINAQVEDFESAKRDLDWLLENRPAGLNVERLRRFREALPDPK